MSRPTHAGPSTTRAARRQGAGRHRLGTATGVRCSDIPAVRERMQFQRPAPVRSSFTRWLFQAPAVGRHTWSFLAGSGGRPRTAFAIILSL
jgi:hypothetical protein